MRDKRTPKDVCGEAKSSFSIEDYIQALKLFPIAYCNGWHGWTWIET